MTVSVIREMDSTLISGAGGYATREEFIEDAVRDKLVELKYQAADPGPGERANSLVENAARSAQTAAPTPMSNDPAAIGLDETVLVSPVAGYAMTGSLQVGDGALLGLHNRDYASFWALSRLADLLVEGPAPFERCVEIVTERAWAFASQLQAAETRSELKLTLLFPKNGSKTQSASRHFQTFAIGTARNTSEGLVGEGPLFAWRALQADLEQGDIRIGLTKSGWELLNAVNGVSLELPHSSAIADAFLAYLEEHAPGDLKALMVALNAANSGVTRPELADVYKARYPDWTDSQISTNAAGYVARSREWGLIEPKLVDRRYRVTPTGGQLLDRLTNRKGSF